MKKLGIKIWTRDVVKNRNFLSKRLPPSKARTLTIWSCLFFRTPTMIRPRLSAGN
ncbi:MAG: hypothetical protein ACLU99_07885 [Alphaproteobacteria bacterium]